MQDEPGRDCHTCHDAEVTVPTQSAVPTHVGQSEPFRWDGIPELRYNEIPGSPFRDVTRRVLFDDVHGLGVQVRYFEVAPGGWSTLEHHGHPHEVIPIRGRGGVLVQDRVVWPELNDLVYVPGWAWHQLRAVEDEPFGFLCLVTVERDRPVLPTPEEIEQIKASGPEVAEFIRY